MPFCGYDSSLEMKDLFVTLLKSFFVKDHCPMVERTCNELHVHVHVYMYLSFPIGPGGTPENFMIVSSTSRSFTLSWSPPDPFLQNGVILGYTLTCQEKLSGTVPSSYPRTNYPHPPPSSVVADDLRPFTEYTCDLTAVNSAGSSDPAIDSSTTGQDGKFATVHVNCTVYMYVYTCTC